jgi:hypothetical protein
MKSFRNRVIVIIGTISLIAALFGQGVATRNVQPEARKKLSGKPFAARFTDIAAEAGLTMSFTSGNEKTKRYIIEANGTGVAFVDYDNDGWLDVFLVNGSTLEAVPRDATSKLYRNTRDGKFQDVTAEANVARSGWGNDVCTGDIDNDGFEDVFVTY